MQCGAGAAAAAGRRSRPMPRHVAADDATPWRSCARRCSIRSISSSEPRRETDMKRRRFLRAVAGAAALAHRVAASAGHVRRRGGRGRRRAAGSAATASSLVLVELKGGNDGLNTRRAVRRPRVLRAAAEDRDRARPGAAALRSRRAASGARAARAARGRAASSRCCRASAIREPNLSHFRSIEIWDTASSSDEYLQEGWLTRAFAAQPVPASFAADGVIIGSPDLGPLAGGGTRAIALADTEQFLRRARLAQPGSADGNRALAHILKVEGDIVQAASHLAASTTFATPFPDGAFGNAVRTACQILANPAGRGRGARDAVGFRHARRTSPARRRGCWARSRRAWSRCAARCVETRPVGRHARGHLRGVRPAPEGEPEQRHRPRHGERAFRARRPRCRRVVRRVARADAAVRRRQRRATRSTFANVYATVLERWWGTDSREALGGRFAPLPFV